MLQKGLRLPQPNCLFGTHAEDSCSTQAAALEYVDVCVPLLSEALRPRGPACPQIFSGHEAAYGEDICYGRRLPHRGVRDVPDAQFLPDAAESAAVDV